MYQESPIVLYNPNTFRNIDSSSLPFCGTGTSRNSLSRFAFGSSEPNAICIISAIVWNSWRMLACLLLRYNLIFVLMSSYVTSQNRVRCRFEGVESKTRQQISVKLSFAAQR